MGLGSLLEVQVEGQVARGGVAIDLTLYSLFQLIKIYGSENYFFGNQGNSVRAQDL